NAGSTMGSYPDGRDRERAEALADMRAMAARLITYADLDARKIFPLGYSVVARRPGTDEPAEPRSQRPEALSGARSFVTLCSAAAIPAQPSLLADYAKRFGGNDDATLVIYAPNIDAAAAGAVLGALVTQLDLDGPDSPDMLALPYPDRAPDEAALA